MATGAYVSFGVAAALAIMGLIGLMKTAKSRLLALAFIPGILAIIECLKGLAWHLAGSNTATGYVPLACLFLLMAVWPWYIPLALLLPEKNIWKRKKIKMLLFIGCCISVYSLCNLLIFDIMVGVERGHLQLGLEMPPGYLRIMALFYLLPALIPPFVSGLNGTKILGVVMLISYGLSQFYFRDDFPQLSSIPAFFAGLSVLVIVWKSNPRAKLVLPGSGRI